MSFTLPCILWSQRILHFQQTIIAKITEMYDQINSIVGEGQWGLACCNSWGCKESNTTEWLNWTELRQHIKKQKHYFTDKGPSNQSYGFSNSHVWIWELHHVRALKNWCFWAVVLEKTLESPLVCKEIKPVNPKGNQSWIFIRRTDAEAEAPKLWPPDAKSPLTGGKPWCWERLRVGEVGDRGWGWMASSTQWTWVRESSGRWWRTGKPGMLQSTGSWRVGLINNKVWCITSSLQVN